MSFSKHSGVVSLHSGVMFAAGQLHAIMFWLTEHVTNTNLSLGWWFHWNHRPLFASDSSLFSFWNLLGDPLSQADAQHAYRVPVEPSSLRSDLVEPTKDDPEMQQRDTNSKLPIHVWKTFGNWNFEKLSFEHLASQCAKFQNSSEIFFQLQLRIGNCS